MVVGTLDLHKWEVVFDYNSEIQVVTSQSLWINNNGVGIPLAKDTMDNGIDEVTISG